MNIEENKLKRMLEKAYEEGWYGSKDQGSEVASQIVANFENEQKSQTPKKKAAIKKGKKVVGVGPVWSERLRRTFTEQEPLSSRSRRDFGGSFNGRSYTSLDQTMTFTTAAGERVTINNGEHPGCSYPMERCQLELTSNWLPGMEMHDNEIMSQGSDHPSADVNAIAAIDYDADYDADYVIAANAANAANAAAVDYDTAYAAVQLSSAAAIDAINAAVAAHAAATNAAHADADAAAHAAATNANAHAAAYDVTYAAYLVAYDAAAYAALAVTYAAAANAAAANAAAANAAADAHDSICAVRAEYLLTYAAYIAYIADPLLPLDRPHIHEGPNETIE